MDHILVVDDDPNIRQLLQDYLRSMGYGATAVESGVQMKQVINTSPVDLVVLDLMLEGEDGLDITRELRRTHAVPIIILSARGGLLDRILGLEMGADDYLPKPFDPRELVAKIKVVLRRTRSVPGERLTDSSTFAAHAARSPEPSAFTRVSAGPGVRQGTHAARPLHRCLHQPSAPASQGFATRLRVDPHHA
jgi:two-component system OmpR family response regulator